MKNINFALTLKVLITTDADNILINLRGGGAGWGRCLLLFFRVNIA